MANSPYDLPDDYESPYQAMASIDIVAIKKGLEEESASKTRALAAAKVRQEQRDNAYEATLAGILGLKGAAAISSDVLARVGNSVGMVLGATLGGATKLGMLPITSAVTDEDIAAYNRIQTGKTLPGDEDRMQSTFLGGGDYTVRDILQLDEDTDSWVRALNDNARPAPTLDAHQDQFIEDLQDSVGTKEALGALQEGTWEGAGDGALASTAGFGKAIWELSKNAVVAGANNPVAVLQYVTDNSAQFALGAFSKPLLAAFTTGYATDYYTKGVKAYADAHEGQLPVGDDHTAILAKAASLGLAEYVGTTVSMGAAAIPRSIVQDVTAASGESLLKRALKGANERVGDAVSKAGGAFYGEALTEGYQTGVEGDLMGKPASAMDIYTGAAIGGLSGGTIATPAATASLTLGATEAARARSEAIVADAQAKKAELEEAIKTGNVTAYTDKASPKYDPLKAVEILQGIASDDKRTATERDDAVTKAQEVFDTVSADLQAVRADLKQQGIVETSPKDVAKALKETKALAEELLAKEPDRDMTNIDKEIARLEKARAAVKTREVARQLQSVQKLGKTLDTIRPMIQELGVAVSRKPTPAAIPTPVTPGATLSTQSASPVASNEGSEDWLTEDEEWNEMVREAEAYSSKTSSEEEWWTPEEIEEFDKWANKSIAESTAPNEAANTKSTASEWLIKSITDMGAMEPDKAIEMADDTTNDLTDSQRTYLRRYSEARLAQNALMNVQGVNRAILSGDPRFGDLGLPDYRTRVAHAVKTGNTRQQRYYTDMLGRWLAYHKSKAAAATRAYNKLKDVEEFRYIAPDENNVWQEVDVRGIPKSQQVQMGVMNINLTQSRKLLPVMGQEVQAIQAAYEELEAMTALGESQSAPVASKPAVAPAKAQEATPASANTQAPVKQESAPKAQPEVTKSAVEKVPVEEAPKEPAVVQKEAAPVAAQEEPKPDAVTDIVAAQTEAEIAEQTIVEDVVPEAPKPQVGTLRALNDATNTEAQGFTQQTGDAGYPRPLTTVVDFLQSWKANASSFIYGFISEKKGELTAEQMLAIKTLYKYLTTWTPLVDKLFVDNDQTHIGRSLYKMFVTTVINEDGSESYVMEENVKVAIVTAALNYIQDQNGMTYRLTDKEINGVLGRKEEDYVTNEEREKYQFVGEFRQKVITTLGKDIISMLGLGINSTTPINKLSQMESSLGAIALHLLTYVGSVKTHGVALQGSTEKTPFVQFRNVWGKGTENNDEILAMNAAIAQSSKGSQSIIARLMGMEEVNREPTLKPEKTTQRDMSVAYQEVPTEHLKHLNEMNKTENYVDAAMMTVMQKLSPETQDVMLGTEYDGGATGEGIQKTRLLSIRAANESLRRNWQNALGFWNTVLKQDGEKPFFLKHMPWTQGRAGIGQNVMNPNSDKIARRLVTRRSWQSKIDLDNPVAVNGFMIAVAAALHIDIDKKSHETALQDAMVKLGWDGTAKGIQTLKNSKYQDAIAALQDMIFEDITPSSEQEDAVISAVLDGEENMHSLQALVALAEMRYAVIHKYPNFITKLTLEVDGVTNGPMLTLLLWGGFHDPRVLEMGGFFQQWSTHEDYNVRRGLPGNKDLYETNAAKLAQYLRLLVSDQQKRVLNAVYGIVGQLEKDGVATSATRKMVKLPLTQLFFGSGLPTINKTIQNTVVDAFYQKLQKAVADYQSGADVQSLEKITEALNDLLYRKVKTSKKNAKVPTFTVYDERMDLNHPKITENRAEFWLNFEMTPKQLTVFKANIEMTLGEATSAVLEDSFGSVIETKQLISRASGMSFTLYNAVREYLHSRRKSTTNDFTKEEFKKLDNILEGMFPRMHTPYSKVSENGIKSAIPMTARKSEHINMTPPYRSEVKLIPLDKVSSGKYSVQGVHTRLEPPGVRATSLGTHGLDAKTSQDAQKNTEALNNHDAHLTGIEAIALQARRLNESLWNNLMEYSPMQEAAETLARTIAGFKEVRNKLEEIDKTRGTDVLASGVVAAVVTSMQSFEIGNEAGDIDTLYSLDHLEGAYIDLYIAALEADYKKYLFMSEMKAVSQYAFQGGAYIVTEQQRKLALAKAQEIASTKSLRGDANIQEVYSNVEESIRSKNTIPVSSVYPIREIPDPKRVETKDKAIRLQVLESLKGTLVMRNQKDSREYALMTAYQEATLSPDSALWNALSDVEKLHIINYVRRITGETYRIKALRNKLLAVGAIAPKQSNTPVETGEVTAGKDVAPVTPEIKVEPEVEAAPVTPTKPTKKVYRRQEQLTMPVVENSDKLSMDYLSQEINRVLRTKGKMDKLVLLRVFNMKQQGTENEALFSAYKEIGMRLLKAMPNIQVILVTSDTVLPKEVVFGEGEYGKYVASPAGDTVYLLESANIDVTAMLHEMVHASLTRMLHAHPEYAHEVKALMEHVKAQMTPQELETFKAAFVDVDEFIAYGMTHRGFQNMMQTKKGRTLGNQVLDAFRGFMGMVLKALGFPANKGTALRDILVLGAELIEKAEKQQANKIADTLVRNITMTVGDVRDYSTQDIFDALDTGSIGRGFASHLRGMLTGMVSKMYGPFGILGKEAMENQPMGPMDIYLNSRGRGSLAFVSEIRAAGVNISDQEAYVAEQIEATVRASLEANTGQLTSAYTQLARMYDEAYKRFPTPEALLEDWSNAPVEEQEQATALHTFLFDLTLSGSGKSNHLAKFAAMVLAVEEVSDKFDYASYNRDSSIDTTTFFGRLLKWFDGIMDWVESHASKTYLGQPANEKVKALINTMVEIEAKRRALVYSRGARKMPGEYIDEGAAYLTNKAKEGLVKFSNSRVFTNSKNVYLRSGGAVLNILATDTLDNYGETLRKFRERLSSEKHGMIAALLTEVRGDTDNTSIFYKMLRATKHLESERQAYITKSANMVNSAFLNSAKFTKEHNEAITTYFIRTGMYSLMDKYSMAELEQMLSNPKLLTAQIEEHEKALVTLNPKFANFWIVAGKSLGHHMITGKAKFQHIGNPYVIARFGGTSLQGKVPESMAKDAQILIDRLASLQAILSGPQAVKKGSKTGMGQRALAASIMREENGRQANGVEFLLRLHRQQLGAAKESLFKDSEALMVKGYSPNTVDPHISIKVATAEELPELKKIGFTIHGEVSKDPNDPDQTAKYLCSIKGSGMRPWLSGIFSTTNLGARGNKQLDDNLNPFTVAGVINRTLLDNVVDAKERDMRSVLYGTYRGFDPRKVKPDYMVPVFNADMQVTNYRYMMSSNNLNNILKRDNRFGHIMGTLEGNTFDKMTSPKQNALAAQALYDHYQANKATDAGAYVYVGFDSVDPELQDIANMFPEHTRQAIRKIWGMNGMMVRRDMLDINFGYRKWSATEALFQSAAEKQHFAKLVVSLFEYLFALNGDEVSRKTAKERAKRWLLNAGDIWEELVAETKDIIVIKTGTVMMHNIVSNFLELKAFGVPMLDILKHHRTALKASIQYKKDKETLFNLETQLNTGFTQGKDKDIARQIVILKDRIVNSPVHRLMEEGLMPTIVEDISNNEDIYSRKTALVEKLEGVTSRIPQSLVKGARFVYMAHDTFLYKKLAEVTQLSDFVARYTLYQYDTTKRHALSHEEAIRKTSDAFINYDIPSHRKLQWGNDMGLVMFTKYYVRIQKVILRTMRDNPLNAILMLLLNNYMDSLPMLYDSGILGNSYGSGLFSTGALEYPGTLDNLLTVNAVM